MNVNLIKEYCDKYGYDCNCFDDTAIISTNNDVWKIYKMEEGSRDNYRVKHANKGGNKTNKMQFHFQRYAPNIDYIFDIVINRHDSCGGVYSEMFKIKNLLATV